MQRGNESAASNVSLLKRFRWEVTPAPTLGPHVSERLDGIAPALRPAAAVLREPVVNTRLSFLTAFAERSLSLGVAESHAPIMFRYGMVSRVRDSPTR